MVSWTGITRAERLRGDEVDDDFSFEKTCFSKHSFLMKWNVNYSRVAEEKR